MSEHPSCFPAVCIDAGDVFPLRRSSGGGVPRGGEGHGPAGGAGVRCGPDHPLCRHLLLTHPGHSVKRDPRQVEGQTPERRTGPETFGSFMEGDALLWNSKAECKRAPRPRPLPSRGSPLCYCHNLTVIQRGTRFRPVVFASESSTRRRRRHPQLADLKAMFWVFTALHHLFVPTAFSGTSRCLRGH